MPREVGLVVTDQKVAETLPGEDVKTIIPLAVDSDQDHDEPANRAEFSLADNLPLPGKRNVAVERDVAKLPGRAATGFNLDGDVTADLIGRDDVVVRDVAGERGRDQSPA